MDISFADIPGIPPGDTWIIFRGVEYNVVIPAMESFTMFDDTLDGAKINVCNMGNGAGERYLNPRDIILPRGYSIEVFAQGIDAPSCFTFYKETDMLIAESGFFSGKADILRLSNGKFDVFAEGFEEPITGVCYHGGKIYVTSFGKVTVVDPGGSKEVIIEGLPNSGDYWNSNVDFGPDGKLYFGQGTATNSGVVGTDNLWVPDHPVLCDYPGAYLILRGQNYETKNMLIGKNERVLTGAFSPYGVPNMPYEVRKGVPKASGSILRSNPDGTELELVAWGLRYISHIKHDRFHRLFAANQGYEVRGSRPIANAPDEFQLIIPGNWYGWPDYAAGKPVDCGQFTPEGGAKPEFIFLNPPQVPPRPFAVFPSSSYICGFDFCNDCYNFGNIGDVYITEYGGGGRAVPGVATPFLGTGHRISKIDINSGGVTTFALNRSGFPASVSGEGGFNRPIDLMFSPEGVMYILDMGSNNPANLSEYIPNTGVIWKVTRV